MILLLGATGFVGQAFGREIRRRGQCFIPLSRRAFDYTRFDLLFDYVRRIRPSLVINAAGYSGRPNMDSCETERMVTFQANTLLPQTISRVCLMTNTPLGQVSSGCIYSGAKVFEAGQLRVERDLNTPPLRRLFDANPERFFGFTELDEPNCTFRHGPCSFLSGTKALAEESLRSNSQAYLWRLRIPFYHEDDPCNLLTKLRSYERIFDHITSLSHLEDYVKACLDLCEKKAPYGTYNVTNPGAVTTRQVAHLIEQALHLPRPFEFWDSDEEFYARVAKAPRSASILDTSKLQRAGVRLRPVLEALEDTLSRWHPEPQVVPWTGSASHLQIVSNGSV